MLRILISDDHAMFAMFVRMWLEQASSRLGIPLECLPVATSGAETLASVQAHKPDILIQDMQLADMNGLDIISVLRPTMPTLKIFVLSGRPDWARAAIDAGANGCMLKEDKPQVIEQILTWDTSAAVWISPALGEKFYVANRELLRYNFTHSELSILRLLHLGNGEIADALGLSEGTIRNTMSTIYQKTNIANRAELLNWAQNVLLLLSLPVSVAKKSS